MQKKQPNMHINMQITETIEAWKHLYFFTPRHGSTHGPTKLAFDHAGVTQWDSFTAWEEVFEGAECPLAVNRPWGHSWSMWQCLVLVPYARDILLSAQACRNFFFSWHWSCTLCTIGGLWKDTYWYVQCILTPSPKAPAGGLCGSPPLTCWCFCLQQ